MTLEQRLENIEAMLLLLVERQTMREWYTTHEFARAVGKAEFSIREYCRLGRLRAEKRQSGRGSHQQWVLSHAELERYRRNGLLPVQTTKVQLYPALLSFTTGRNDHVEA